MLSSSISKDKKNYVRSLMTRRRYVGARWRCSMDALTSGAPTLWELNALCCFVATNRNCTSSREEKKEWLSNYSTLSEVNIPVDWSLDCSRSLWPRSLEITLYLEIDVIEDPCQLDVILDSLPLDCLVWTIQFHVGNIQPCLVVEVIWVLLSLKVIQVVSS